MNITKEENKREEYLKKYVFVNGYLNQEINQAIAKRMQLLKKGINPHTDTYKNNQELF